MASAEPLHRQLYDEIRRAILAGRLAAGSRLPASRELANVTRVSRNTVLSAYEQLLAEGYIQSRAGSGTFVAYSIPDAAVPESTQSSPPESSTPRALSQRGTRVARTKLVDLPVMPTANTFRPGLPALDHFPMDIWRRLMDRRLRRASVRMLSYDDPQGYLPLREAIAAHLGAARGARCSADQIMIVNGSQQAIHLVTRMLPDPGDTAWLEDPGYFAARAALSRRPCPWTSRAWTSRRASSARRTRASPTARPPTRIRSASRSACRAAWRSCSGPRRTAAGCSRTTTRASTATPAARSRRCRASTRASTCSTPARSARCCSPRCGSATSCSLPIS
ncbi:MAG: PLP-dependent aminotransferase family protein [Candidatus Eisenbacteria bacterium]|nr:PLP-dependent aminotransferase family protein [Candidatus Eisenbacteria bacterium]